MGTKFLNIELEVRAVRVLEPLLQSFSEEFLVNYCDEIEPGKFFLSGAHACGGLPGSCPDEAASKLCDLIEGLSGIAKELWDTADDRVMDVGLDANLDRNVIIDLFSPETMARIARLNSRIAVSVYTLDIETKAK